MEVHPPQHGNLSARTSTPVQSSRQLVDDPAVFYRAGRVHAKLEIEFESFLYLLHKMRVSICLSNFHNSSEHALTCKGQKVPLD
jgi:hypothetical protein